MIDEASPLYELRQGRDASLSTLILTIAGYDENMAQEVRARHWYDVKDIRCDHRYANSIKSHSDGSTMLNYDRFHDLKPDGHAATN